MKKAIQEILLRGYRLMRTSGLLDLPLVKAAYPLAYLTYKRLWEEDIGHLGRYVRPGTWVIDIGANIGFFSDRLCGWVSEGGKVLAFEPDVENFATLRQLLNRHVDSGLLVARQSLVSEVDGSLPLLLNPDNRADHRIGEQGIQTPSTRLDSALAQLGRPRVSLVKIDVQGAEGRVLAGAREMLLRDKPVLFVELHDEGLALFGTSSLEIREQLEGYGYSMYQSDGRSGTPLTEQQAAQIRAKLGYADFLFIPDRS